MPLEFIRSYAIADEIDWLGKTLSTNWLHHYTDQEVEGEFLRFMYRDLLLMAFCAATSIYCLVFPWVFGILGMWFQYVMYAVGACTAVVCASEAYAHFGMEATAQTAKWREWNVILFILFQVNSCTWTMLYIYTHCENAPFVFGHIGGYQQDLTYERKNLYCLNVINPYVIVGQIVCLIFIRFRPAPLVALSILNVGMFFVGNFLASLGTNGRVKSTKIIVHLVVTLFGIVIGVIRDSILRTQFAASVETLCSVRKLDLQKNKLDQLLVALLPTSALTRLMQEDMITDETSLASILYSDIVQFTKWSSSRTPMEVVKMLNTLCIKFDAVAAEKGVEKVKTIGDAYWAVCGLPEAKPDHAECICSFGLAMFSFLKKANARNPQWNNIQLRIGIHSGGLCAGNLGKQQMSYEVFGIANHIAEEIEQQGVAGEVVISIVTKQVLDEENVRRFQIVRRQDIQLPASVLFKGHHLLPTYLVRPLPRGDEEDDETRSLASTRVSSLSSMNQSSNGANQRECREKFLQETLKGRRKSFAVVGESVDDDEEELEASPRMVASPKEVCERLSIRRYSSFIYTFDDDHFERHYEEFALVQLRSIKLANALFFLAILLVAFICFGIERAEFQAAPTSLLSLALVCALFNLAPNVVQASIPPQLSTVSTCLICTLSILGCGLMPSGSIGNDVMYLVPIFATVLSISLTNLHAIVVCGLYLLCVFLPAVIMGYKVHFVVADFFFALLLSFVVLAGSVLAECLLRKQFAEKHLTDLTAVRIEEQRDMQQKLMARILPSHIVGDLLAWFDSGLDVEKSVCQDIGLLSVMFIQVISEEETPSLARKTSVFSLLRKATASVSLTPPTSPSKSNNDLSVSPESPDDNPLYGEGGTSAIATMMAIREINHKIEHYLEESSSAIIKIKTIGDLILVAGPFLASVTITTAAEALCRLAFSLQQALREDKNVKMKMKAGMHIGPVVAAIVGLDRLAFDIFGDTVNTASRVMSTTSGEGIFVTKEFADLLVPHEKKKMEETAEEHGVPVSHIVRGTSIEKYVVEEHGQLPQQPLSINEENMEVCFEFSDRKKWSFEFSDVETREFKGKGTRQVQELLAVQ